MSFTFVRFFRKCIIIFIFLFSGLQIVNAQTTLAAGDIAFTGYIGNGATGGNDEFSFVLLKDIASGTVINFTDNGWVSGSLRTIEGTISWTANSSLAAGTEISVVFGTTITSATRLVGGGGGTAGSIAGTALSLSANGDQILAYQGSSSSPTFISAIHTNVYTLANNDPVTTTAAAWDGSTSNVFSSGLPAGLTTGVNAIWIGTEGDISSEKHNARFSCGSFDLSTVANIKAVIYDQANWTTSDEAPGFTLPTTCSYMVASGTTITSINRVGSTPTNASSVQYTVVFGASVTGVATSNFSLTTTGVSSASVASVSGSGTTYTVTVNTGTGSGNITLNLANATGISPSISTTLPFAGQTYAIDKTAPTLSAVTIASNNANTARAKQGDIITLSITSNETITSPTVTIAGASATVTGAGTSWTATLTVGAGTTEGVAAINIAFADAVGNAGTAVTATTNSSAVTVDRTVPTLTAVTIASNNANTARAKQGDIITLSITSSETVATPTVTIAGAAATVTGAGTSWTATLTVGAGTTEGVAAINIAFTDAAGNAGTAVTATTNSSSVTIDRTTPTVTSINRQTPLGATTNGASVVYRVTFSESVSGVDITDFSLTATGTAAGSIASVSASSGTTIDVTVNSITGDGTLRLDLKSTGTGIIDAASNAIAAGYTSGQTYTIDRVAPSLSAVTIASNNANTARAKQGDIITLSITSSETITTPTVTLAGVAATVTGSGTSWTATLTVGAGTTEGVAAINIAFADAAGNAGTAVTATTNSSAVIVDRTAPSLSAVTIASNNANTARAKQGDVITLSITSSETITTPTVTIAGTSATVTGSGTSWTATLTVGAGTAEGVAAINIAFTDITGNAGTAVTATTNSSAVTVDRTAPTLSAVTIVSNNTNTARAKQGDIITLSITSNETIATPTVTIAGASATVTGSGISWTATLTVGAGTTEGAAAINIAFADAAGNAGTAVTATTNSSSVTIDRTTPTVTSINRQTPLGATTNGSSVVYRVSFSESVSGVDITDFSLTATGTAAGSIASVSASSGTTIDVTVNGITGDGTLRLDLKSTGTGIIDAASNAIAAGYTSGQTYTIDQTVPTLTAVTIASNNANTARAKQGDIITLSITSSETITTPTVTLAGTAATVTGSGTSWTATLTVGAGTTEGVAAINIAFADAAGNAGTAVTTTTNSSSITVDKTGPTVSSINRQTPSGTTTNGSSVVYRVSFSESVSGVDITDFSLTTTGTAAGNIASVSASSGTVIDITVNTITGDGTLRLDLKSTGTGIIDATSNAIASGYTTGEIYTIDRVAPTLIAVTIASNNANTARAKQGDIITVSITSSEAITTPTITIAGTSATVTNSGGNNWTATLTVGAGTTEGAAAINISYTDIAGNTGTAVTATTNSSSVTIDRTAPSLSAVTIASNNANTARAKQGDIITLSITSSEAITTPTVTLAGTAATVTGSGASWTATLTVGAGTTEGAAAINIAFADVAGNAGTAVTATTNSSSVTIDRTAPTLSAVTIVSNNGNAARAKQGDVITLSITSSETITTPTVTIAGASATVTGSGTSWTASLTVGAGTTEGVAAINIAFTDITGNAGTAVTATTNSSSVTVDRTAPSVTNVAVPANGTYISGQNLNFTVNFNEAITLTGTPRIPVTLNVGGTVNAEYVSGSGTTALLFRYTVAAGNADVDGITVGNAIALNGGSLKDGTSNDAILTLNSIGATTNVLVDAIAPTITSVLVPTNGTRTTGDQLNFVVNMSENTIVNTVGGIPSITITVGSSVRTAVYQTGTGTTALTFRYTVQAGDIDDDGIAVGTTIVLNGGSLKDAINNDAVLTLNSVGSTTGVLVDAVAPSVTSINRQTPLGATTNGSSVVYRVSFSESVSGVDITDFSLTATGTAAGSISSVSASSGTTIDVTVNSITGDGTLRLDLKSTGTGIIDAASNAIAAGYTSGQTYTIDRVAPSLSAVTITSNNTNTARAKQGDIITLSITSSETITTPTVTLAGTAATVTGSGTSWTATLTVGAGTTEGVAAINIAFTDAAGNAGTAVTATTNSSAVIVDRTAPSLSAVTIASNNTNTARAKQGDIITLNFTSSETVAIPPVVTIAGTTVTALSVGSNNWTATLTVGAGTTEGVAAINIAFTDITGNAGTAVTATTNSSAVTIDRTAPSLSAVTIASNNANTARAKQGDIITLSITSSETITTPTVTLAGTAATVTGAGTSWTATLTVGAGTIEGAAAINIAFADVAGNAGTAVTATTNSSAVTVDRTVPTLTSITIASNNGNPARAKQGDIITVAITSSEAITSPTVTIAGVAATVTGSGTSWTATLTVGAGTTEGVAAINIAFTDAAGNTGTAVTATTNSSSVTIDRTAPIIVSINRQTPTIQLTTSSTLVYRVITSEPVIGINTNSFSLTTTGGVSGTIASVNAVNATTYDITVNNVTIGGSVRLDVKATGNSITDISGNALIGGFISGQTYISNFTPVFTTSANASNFAICQNSSAYDISSLLQVTDADNTQTLSWTVLSNASNGTLTGFPANSTTNNGTVMPLGLKYTPNNGFSGTDIFTIQVSDGFATATITINVTINALPVLMPITGNTSVCLNNSTQLTNSTTGGVWNSNTGVANISSAGLVTGIAVGTTLISYTVTNSNGCTSSVNAVVNINPYPIITAVSSSPEVSKGTNVQLTATSDRTGSSFVWTPAQNISSPNSAITNARVTENTTYTVTVTTNLGCSRSTSVTVNAKEDLYVEPVNVFTPNGDGINDRFIIKNLDQYPNNKLQVFDRTGKTIYEQNNYANTWDGTVNGKQLTKDTYFYILTVKGQIVKKGTITLVR